MSYVSLTPKHTESVSSNARINTPAIHNLTKSLIIHPIGKSSVSLLSLFQSLTNASIAAGLSGLAVLFGLCESRHHDRRSRRSRPGTILMSLCAALAAILTFAAFIIDMVLFGTVRKRFRDQGIPAQYGNANWLTIGALASLLLAFCLGICGVMHRHRKY